MTLRSLVVDVGARLGRSATDVEPFLHSLQDNWYDSIDSVLDASADDLASIGLPRRFAVELAAAAPGFRKGGGGKGKSKDKGKGKSKDKGKDDDRKGKGKGKSRGRSGGELRHTIPIDVHDVAGDFVFRPRIIGTRGSNVHHIQDQCGVTISLQGQQEEGELALVITANEDSSMDKAIQMCEDLINTVFAEYDEYGSGGGDRGGSRKGGKGKKGDRKGDGKGKKGKGKGKKGRECGEDETEERVPVDTEGIDPDFYLRAKLVGEGGVNVKHIEGETGCHVAVSHDDGAGMAFVIQGKEDGQIASAKEMCEDLLTNVLESVGATPKRSKGEGKGKKGKGKKGKGEGKRREREFTDTDDQPSKRSREE